MRRICIVTPFPERRGGSDNVLMTFLRHVDRERFDPLVVFLGAGGFEREVAGLGIRTQSLPSGRLRNPFHVAATIVRIARVLRRERPALVVNWLSTAQVYGGPAAALAGLRQRNIWWQHDLHIRGGRGRVLDRIASIIPARAVGACSRAAADHQAEIRPRRAVFVVLPGIDEPTGAGAELPEGEDPEVPPGRFVVGTVGRLVAWKGHDKVLAAVAALVREGHDVHALVVGGGGHRADERYEATLAAEVGRLGLAGRVTFTGQVPDAGPWIRRMDALVNAAENEPFGLVLLEAMDFGVPVVAVNSAGPAEIVEDGSSGVLVAAATASSIAGGIRNLLNDPGRRVTIASAGQARRRERFSGARMTREMEARFEELSA